MPIKYPLYQLDDGSFEDLVTSICEEVLGMGTVNFSAGKDGGRDGKFVGVAEKFPSAVSPWSGITIIQAKHTSNPVAKCSDSEFQSILSKSILPALAELKTDGQVNNYLLFTNRRLSGLSEPKITDIISTDIDVENRVLGVEKIQSILAGHPSIVKKHELDKFLLPFVLYPADIRDIILAVHQNSIPIQKTIQDLQQEFIKPDIEDKNNINKLGEDYFNWMKQDSISYFQQIKDFLSDPKNQDFKDMYDNAVSDIQSKVLISQDNYDSFELILSGVQDVIVGKETEGLRPHRKKVRLLLHYMYFNCDIGKKL
ncbi:hypothetical protein KBD71_03135 [Candidatus Woesebacteria bacterium]|nr:hypothetical protein [Candidatus Woesebacteria bacterium]